MELPQHPRIGPLTLKQLAARKALQLPTLAATATLSETRQAIAEHDVGAVVVIDGDRVVGVFSARDYTRLPLGVVAAAGETPLAQVMPPPTKVCFASPAQSVVAALQLMTEERLAYLPVLDNGKLVALLSLSDLLHEIIAHQQLVCQANALDQRIMFLQGTYSC